MNNELFLLPISVWVGIGSTLLLDGWNGVLKYMFKIPSLNMCFLGRWSLHIGRGKIVHHPIGASKSFENECLIGWITHYLIGVGLTCVFWEIVSPSWKINPTLGPALLFGILTLVFPLFVLQPALGLGVASTKTKHPIRSIVKSLFSHLVFGLGIYFFTRITNELLR